jgi:hypothetical protein
MGEASTSRFLEGSQYICSIAPPPRLILCSPPSRFERELEALRKELAESTARSGHSTPEGGLSRGASESDLSSLQSITPLELSPDLDAKKEL